MSENTFSLSRVIGYRNSFLPIIKGIVERDAEGAKVSLKIRLHPIVCAFMIVYFDATGILCLDDMVTGFGTQNAIPNTISTNIRSCKFAAANYGNPLGLPMAWLSRFHGHIIRNETSFHRISALKTTPPTGRRIHFVG